MSNCKTHRLPNITLAHVNTEHSDDGYAASLVLLGSTVMTVKGYAEEWASVRALVEALQGVTISVASIADKLEREG